MIDILAEVVAKRAPIGGLTIREMASMLYDTGLIEEQRLRQYLAVVEFHDKIAKAESKAGLIETLAVKYEISERCIYDLLKNKRFNL